MRRSPLRAPRYDLGDQTIKRSDVADSEEKISPSERPMPSDVVHTGGKIETSTMKTGPRFFASTLFRSGSSGTAENAPHPAHLNRSREVLQKEVEIKRIAERGLALKAAFPQYLGRYDVRGIDRKGPPRYTAESRTQTMRLKTEAPDLLEMHLALDIQEMIRRNKSKSRKLHVIII